MSMINRHNYEEFFLLYADNELTQPQRAEVEFFVQQNPDLAAELEMFEQVKLTPEDDIVFPGKASLYKTTDVEININNYAEFFYLYIDRELDAATNEKVERFVLQHPQLQDEFTLLKQTVLQPEAITFGDKSSLYRTEERRRVVPVMFTRFAVAAAVIGLTVAGWWFYPNGGGVDPADSHPVAKTTDTTVQPGKPAEPATAQTILPGAKQQVQQTTPQVPNNTVADTKAPKQRKTLQIVQQLKDNNALAAPKSPDAQQVNNNEIAAVNNNSSTQNPVIITPPASGNESGTIAANLNDRPVNITTSLPGAPDEIKQGGNNHDAVAKNDNKYPVAYKIIDTDDENRSMYVGSLELNKDKVKGLLKRVFGGKAKKEDIENK